MTPAIPPTNPPTTPPPAPPPAPRPAPTLTVRSPEDVLAAVPVLLGFEPDDSVVMLTFGGREGFHARVDLPGPRETDAAVGLLVGPAVTHAVQQVVLVAYTSRARRAERVVGRLHDALAAAGIEVVVVLRTDGRRWFLPGEPGVPYDVGAHPFRARSVLDGQVVSRSRDELAARLAPAEGVAAVRAALVASPAYDAAQVAATVWRALEAGRFTDDELAGVLRGIGDPAVRDAAWGSMTRADAAAHVGLWTDAVQRAPRAFVGSAAAVLAVAAWLSGHGALAWCAVDRATEADPACSLARLVGDLLVRAVPPSAWDEMPLPPPSAGVS